MPVITSTTMLRDEASTLHGENAIPKATKDEDLYARLNALGRGAICFSGGGIRSASFCLGVLQALARHPRGANSTAPTKPEESLLCQFHYLSTVRVPSSATKTADRSPLNKRLPRCERRRDSEGRLSSTEPED